MSQGDLSVRIITRYLDTMKELGESIADIRKEEAKVTRGSSGNHHVVTGR